MSVTINTLHGTFIVPTEREGQLIAWLQANAVKAGQQENIMEVRGNDQRNNPYTGTQLINE